MSDATRDGQDALIPQIRIMRRTGREQRATFFELFFDLVYVFAVTQLSHHLLATHLTWTGAAETAFMLVAVYWAWNYTTWMANWFDPDTVPIRLVLTFVMLASLIMAVAIPRGFGELALLFACSYSVLQIGRNLFVVVATPPGRFHQNFRQILAWSVLSAPLWVAGGLVEEARWPLWLAALAIDLAGPLAKYWLPGVGGTPMSQWAIDGHHFAERFQLFIIIALGESIVLTGVTASGAEMNLETGVALSLSFLGSVALWWLYFSGASPVIVRRIGSSTSDDVGSLGRDIFTYLHLPIVAGIVLMAVGDELVVAHPGHELEVVGALAVLGGPALFLLGLIACGVRVGHHIGPASFIAVGLLLAGVPVFAGQSGLVTSGFVLLVLGVLAVVEHRREARGASATAEATDTP
ncbi:low temperature requirement protein A [Jiangella mangrovi]|uniref:Low temperature requirement protein LtrA n=1 Tax=Jiangella mangrovi TaxID=1524084 RepID=A0A7W9GY95_9ACTN|nr:low temperature requirement protein A [Jiangella mangrovi]MBB5791871.1 low temperature requirement protein LtrA [Jiangella mangrovi]